MRDNLDISRNCSKLFESALLGLSRDPSELAQEKMDAMATASWASLQGRRGRPKRNWLKAFHPECSECVGACLDQERDKVVGGRLCACVIRFQGLLRGLCSVGM